MPLSNLTCKLCIVEGEVNDNLLTGTGGCEINISGLLILLCHVKIHEEDNTLVKCICLI